MGKIKLFPTAEYGSKQPSDPVVPLVPCTGIFLGPSKSGKTVALISMILEQYRGVFEKIYIFSPSINIDDGWIPVKKYIEEDLGVNAERERAYYDEWDEAALRDIIQRQRKITETSKKLEMKKLYQVLVVIDDFADTPQLHKAHGALDTLFIRGRHLQISTWVSSQKLRLISAAVRVNMQAAGGCATSTSWRPSSKSSAPCCRRTSCTGSTSRRLGSPTASSSSTTSSQRIKCSTCASHWKEKPMGAALSFLGQKLFASSTLINARCENISCCTSSPVAHHPSNRWPPMEKKDDNDLRGQPQEGSRLRQRLRGRPESLHLQSDARLAVYKIRIADSFLSTDRGRYLYWVDAALGTLNWALLPEGAYTGSRLAAWISSNFATATYSETTNSLSVAYDGNRLILNDLELQQQFPDAVDYPTSPGAPPSKPFSIDHMLGPSFVSGGQQVFEFVRMNCYNEVYLRCPQLANASRVLGNLGDDILSKITLKSGVGTIVETGSDDGHFMAVRGPITLRHLRFRLTDLEGQVVRLRGSSLSFVLFLDHV